MNFNEKDILTLKKFIENANTITLLSHNNPDGDAIGSTSAMFHYLKEKGKNVVTIFPNNPPEHLKFIHDGVNPIVVEKEFQKAKQRLQESDLLMILDMNALHRSNENLQNIINELSLTKILIDHHEKPETFDLNFSYPDASATCEVVYSLLNTLENKEVFSKAISLPLYCGIMTDTGSLSYSCDHPEIYYIVGNLVKAGLEPRNIHYDIFNKWSEKRMKLFGYATCKKLEIFEKERAAYIWLTKEELKDYDYKTGDLEGLVNECLKLEKVDFGILVSERKDHIKLNFRSKYPTINVEKFASKWNGGGHIMAAAAKSKEPMEVVREKLKKQIKAKEFLSE